MVNAAICSAYQSVGIYDPGRLASAGAMPGTEVAATTLSRVLSDFGVRDGYTLFMDIEGSESDLLTNDASALERCSMMIVELHDAFPLTPIRGAARQRSRFPASARWGSVCVTGFPGLLRGPVRHMRHVRRDDLAAAAIA